MPARRSGPASTQRHGGASYEFFAVDTSWLAGLALVQALVQVSQQVYATTRYAGFFSSCVLFPYFLHFLPPRYAGVLSSISPWQPYTTAVTVAGPAWNRSRPDGARSTAVHPPSRFCVAFAELSMAIETRDEGTSRARSLPEYQAIGGCATGSVVIG